jgi:hypothetical protein
MRFVTTVFTAFLATIPLAAAAETPLTAEEFAAIVTGATITYGYRNSAYKTEEYLPGRKVRWLSDGGICGYGNWYQDGDDICFADDDDLDPSCWRFYLRSGVIQALEAGVSNHTIIETSRTASPIICTDPDK